MPAKTSNTPITPAPMIYASLFGTCNPNDSTIASYIAAATDLAESGFATVNVWQFHVDGSGNLLVNAAAPGPALISGGSLQSGFSYVPEVIAALTAAGGKVTTIRATIGGWGLDNTFNNMVQLINQFGTGPANPLYQNFVALKALGISGIDLDLEPAGGEVIHDYPYYIGPLAQLITMIAELGLSTTFCPYQNENFWLVLLAAVCAQNDGAQPVQSMNVQCYSGGAGNTQSGWIEALKRFPSLGIGMAGTVEETFGISDPASFVVPGFGVLSSGQPQCPNVIQQALTAQGFARKGISAAYLFNYANIQTIQQDGSCPDDNATADYANALIAGINAVNGVS